MPVFRTCAKALTRNPWAADDVAQETLLRAWRYQDSYSSRGSFENGTAAARSVVDVATA